MIENGIIKIKTVNGVTYGITHEDMRQTLGVAGSNMGAILQVANVNKWAKYKPIKRSGLHFSSQLNSDFTWKTEQQIAALGETPWWKNTDGKCGLTFQTYSSLGTQTIATTGFFHDLLTTSPSWPLAWGYEKPTGGISQYPFRRRDFNYYDHSVPKPVTGVYDNLQLYDNGKLTVQLDESRAANGLGLELSDITLTNPAVSAWYVGILIYKSGSFAYAFSANTIGNGADSVEFTGMGNFAGQVTIVPFLSSVRWNQGGQEQQGTFISCDVAPQTVTIQSEQQYVVTMSIDAQWRFSLPGPVKYDVRIINNSGSTISVANMVIALYDGDPNNGGVRVEYKPTIATFNMTNGTVHDETGTFANQNYDPTKTYYVVVTSDRTEVNGKQAVVPRQ